MDLRKQADVLGIPFTNDTRDDELRVMIAARNNQPEGLPPLDPSKVVPDCFGLMWSGDSDDSCKSCEVEKHCLAKLADVTISRLNIENGRDLTPPELAVNLGLPLSSISIALERRAARFQKAIPPPPPPPEPEPDRPKEESVKPKKRASKSKSSSEPVQASGVSDPPSAGSASPVAGPATTPSEKSATPAAEQAPSESRIPPGPSGKVQKATKNVNLKSDSLTSSTASEKGKTMSKPAKKSAKKAAPKKAPPKKVEPKKASPQGVLDPWGEHTFKARWEREREKSPLIAKSLPPGSKRSREYKGCQYELQVREGHYLLNGEKHATLYSTTMYITGGKSYSVLQKGKKVPGKQRQMSNWSGSKFWGLKAE